MKSLIALLALVFLAGCATTEVGSLYAAATEPAKKPRDIFVAIDGTGNSQISRTNAARLYEFVDNHAGTRLDRTTATYYAEGVGSRGQALGLTVGYGMAADVKGAYAFLTETYRSGDRIFLSGFSRGAYGVRILGGFIAIAGIPDLKGLSAKQRKVVVDQLYDAYKTSRRREETPQTQNERRLRALRAILDRHGIEPRGDNFGTSVEAMALWDTVEALGRPDGTEDPIENLDHYLITTCNVAHVYQALSLDDDRAYSFTPIFASGPLMREACPDAPPAHVEEVWFAGAHADVGGSYAPKDRVHGFLQGVSLNWMLDRLRPQGLFHKDMRVFEDRLGPIHDAKAYTIAYKPLYRNFREPLSYHEVAKSPGKPRVHISAFERMLVMDDLDAAFPQCADEAPPPGLPRLLCSDDLKLYGFIPELLSRECLWKSAKGLQLRRGQTCVTIVCDDGRDDEYYCGKAPTLAALLPEDRPPSERPRD